ncbi:glycosyltransferase [Rhodoferax sp.]|uniref:glycosyltransferase n=1 Tax=Rhodoferax sp. TaxID=50421 RepID=UPI00284BB6F3|nr:glycosyltransferase [Rhodoferax sp.]MDR3368608.1 glycosyltransferase [Rhodoferax sp.]
MTEQINTKKPLVSFALFAYNQEKYIREAVEGALAQTYSPLQIILSDDCSSDRTFQIMQEMVTEYAGTHEILLIRNEINIGLAEHINRVAKLCKGELIIVAAGDDISMTFRTSRLLDFYLDNDRPGVVFSDCLEIDNDGNLWLGQSITQKEQDLANFIKRPLIRGATCAWSREIFDNFEELMKTVTSEDQPLPVRAYIIQRPPRMLNEKLLKFRRDNLKIKGSKNISIRVFWQFWPLYSSAIQMLIDANGKPNIDSNLKSIIINNEKEQRQIFDLITEKSAIEFAKKSFNFLLLKNITIYTKACFIKFGSLGKREKILLDSLN